MFRATPLLAALLLIGCQSSLDDSNNQESDSLLGEGNWTPTLSGIADQQALPATNALRARHSVINAARAAVLNNPSVREALGDNALEFEAGRGDVKGNVIAQFLFFRYDTATTIEAMLLRDGSVNLRSYPAAEFQPAENEEELDSAIQLARITLESGGFDTSGLMATALLTHPTPMTMSSADQSFYEDRIYYVTFGAGDGQLPELRARVNLTQYTVSNGRLVR